MGTRREEARRRRVAILAAAETAFGDEGWHAARVEDIAEAAGVSKGLVFDYWPSKDGLFDEVRMRLGERFRGWIESAVRSSADSPDADALATLSSVIAAATAFFAAYPAARVVFSPIISPTAPDAADPEADLFADTLEDYVSAAIDLDEQGLRRLVTSILTGGVGAMLGAWVTMDVLTPDGVSAVAADFAIGGLTNIGSLDPVGARPPRPRRPARGRPARMSAAERRRTLIDAAERVFARDGFDAARLEDVAAEAGVTRATIFKHWESKQALFIDVRNRVNDAVTQAVLAGVEAADTLADRIVAAGDALIDWHALHPQAQRLITPVPSLPSTLQLDAGTGDLLDVAAGDPALAPVVPVLPLLAPAFTGAGRAAVRSMHDAALHPGLVKQVFRMFSIGAAVRVGAALGVEIEGAGIYLRDDRDAGAGAA